MNDELEKYLVLIVRDELMEKDHLFTSAVKKLRNMLGDKRIDSLIADDLEEGLMLAKTNMDIDGFLIAVDAGRKGKVKEELYHLLQTIRKKSGKTPVFLLGEREETGKYIAEEVMEYADSFIWIFEESPRFIAGRVKAALTNYRNELFPPLWKAVFSYNEEQHEFSYAAPGHQGGAGFTKNPLGKKFYDFYGENLFRTDTGIERSSIGSLLDHEGAFRKSEEMAAKIFGSDMAFSGVVGTSGSNRTVMQSLLSDGDIALCDRNCHKSIEQGLILTGALPVYMIPERNSYGIIGPLPPSEMFPEKIRKKIEESPLIKEKNATASYGVVTNCTYDGITINAEKAREFLGKTLDHIHFDEAWYGYARFHPVYKRHFAMEGEPSTYKGATLFATTSTHKLLNGLSQSSYIFVRNGRGQIPFFRFNQAYCMHTTTSPLYAICASNDVGAKMMGTNGFALMEEVLEEAVDFRQAVAGLEREFLKKGSWFFRVWNNPVIQDPVSGNRYDFADAPPELLLREQSAWQMKKEDNWHGFTLPEEEWAMLDPVKVSLLTPGMSPDGKMASSGVPAALVSAFLYEKGFVPARCTDFQLMFLFSMGSTRGKWAALLNTLLSFKRLYDSNVPLKEVLPRLTSAFPEEYEKIQLRTLGEKMYDFLRENTPDLLLNNAFSILPEQKLSPRLAYNKLVKGEVELVESNHLQGRIAGNAIIPYPPGIPLLISGESFGSRDCPHIKYLHILEKWDRNFPGFEHEVEGLEKQKDGRYALYCVKE